MPLRKYRYSPDVREDPRDGPRLAVDHDGFIASPVHAMHENLLAYAHEQPPAVVKLYPGWFRLGFPLVASAGLWAGILWAVGYLR